MKFKHIIWDYDGTLFDSYPVMAAAFSHALEEYGFAEPADIIMAFMKVSMGHAIRHYTEKYKLNNNFLERFKALNINAEHENTKSFDGVAELCHAVCESGGENYLFTHRGESAFYYIEKYGLTGCFTEFICSKQNFPRKPSPDAILYLLEKYKLSSDAALMVGDRDLDILSAKNAGIYACYFANGSEPSGIADFNINYFSELYKILGIKES
jgi:HAD superfamily hydrolase (TIGR01549 family)